jgi:peptidyl-prolyl cis-trans isomerase A (cyclophilin A)
VIWRLAISMVVAAMAAAPAAVLVRFDTDAGSFTVEVDSGRAPITATNFLRYVDAGLYDSGAFMRAVRPGTETRTDYPIQVVQARIDQARRRQGFAPIPLERTRDTGLRHVDGAVSMARAGVDSATNEFFICVGPQPELDFGGRRNPDGQGFAVFGRVVRGMDAIRRIQGAPVRPGSQTLDPPVAIRRAVRLPGSTWSLPLPR